MKKALCIVVTMVMLLMLIAGCSNKPAETQQSNASEAPATTQTPVANENAAESKPEPEKTYKIGICVNNLTNPYRVVDFAAGEEWFKNHSNYSYVYTAADNNVTTQIADMEDLIAQKCDAILINCINENAMTPVLMLAKESGIPVFAWDRNIENTELRAGVTMKDNYTDFVNIGKEIIEHINGKGKICMMLGFAGNAVTEDAKRGLLDAWANYSDIKIVNESYCKNNRAEAITIFESVILAHPDLDVVMCENDEVAMGVLQVLEAEGKTDKIFITGHDGQREALKFILDGKIGLTAMNPMLLERALDQVKEYLETGKLDEEVWISPVIFIDKTNVADYYDPDSIF